MKLSQKERSAGGLVLQMKTFSLDLSKTKILMIRVKNLLGKIVWTFPKGHLENGETNLEAALREVKEETGWHCKPIYCGKKKYFEKVRYEFYRQKNIVKKVVTWFLMSAQLKKGGKDEQEVLEVRWVSLKKSKDLVSYPSDKKLLKKLLRQGGNIRHLPRSFGQ